MSSSNSTVPEIVTPGPSASTGLMWVPAHLHPQLAPHEFRNWVNGLTQESEEPPNVGIKSEQLFRRRSSRKKYYNGNDDTSASRKSQELQDSISDGYYDVADDVVEYSDSVAQLQAVVRRRLSLQLPKGFDEPVNVEQRNNIGLKRSVRTIKSPVPTSQRLRVRRKQTEVASDSENNRDEDISNEASEAVDSPVESDKEIKVVHKEGTEIDMENKQNGTEIKSFVVPTHVSVIQSDDDDDSFRLLKTFSPLDSLQPEEQHPEESHSESHSKKSWWFFTSAHSSGKKKSQSMPKSKSFNEETANETKNKKTISKLFKKKSPKYAEQQTVTFEEPISIPSNTNTVKYTNYYTRFPLHIERSIYQRSHVKLANTRRPLWQQVLISNMMLWYLGIVSQQEPGNIITSTRAAQESSNVRQQRFRPKKAKKDEDEEDDVPLAQIKEKSR